jgi:hypothetical protein
MKELMPKVVANHEKEDIMAGWLGVKVEDELAKLNHGDHELGSL